MGTEINMLLDENTRISTLIKANPLVIETLAKLNPHFSKLRNPILRNILAKRVTILDACRISGCKTTDFLNAMSEIGFIVNTRLLEDLAPNIIDNEHIGLPEDLEIIELDVRPVLAQKNDPLKLIISKFEALRVGQCLKIVNTFEPVPLINLLQKKGFSHRVERPDADTVITWFFKQQEERSDQLIPDEVAEVRESDDFDFLLQKYQPTKLQVTDVRKLDMPLPMTTILDLLEKLPGDEALFVYHKKAPVFLLPELMEKGFSYRFKNIDEGNVNILIFKE